MSHGDDIQVVVFRVGGQEFAFNVFHVQRILRHEAPSPLPKAPAFLEGILQVQGAVVPVIDLRKRFELADARLREETRMMVIECEGLIVAVVVDAVLEVLRISAEVVTMPPAVVRGLAAEYIQGIITVGPRTVVLLQTARLLTSTERIALQAVHAEPVHG
ncbi:MAG: purine-binding chemotaxis protein CheW [Gemmatimonadetes bacterium]|nr:purine-binding chemotaxis protein CheW [Gemmatimonadota bacterium]